MQLTKISKFKIIHTPGKTFSVADMLSCSFTKAELQLNTQVLPQIDFVVLHLKINLHICTLGLRSSKSFLLYAWVCFICVVLELHEFRFVLKE